MNYTEVIFTCNPVSEIVTEILAAQLATIGFESFVESDNGLTAYTQSDAFDAQQIDAEIDAFPLDVAISYSFNVIEGKNWNEEWEQHFFEPILFEDQCVIRSSFHSVDNEYPYEILIDPKMAFGTGHHQTTSLVIREMLKMDFNNQTVLDMGCGTAVLAILASMKGAKEILAIDIDEWAYNNAVENVELNNIDNVTVKLGGVEQIGDQTFDTIIANINRNILLEDIPHYAKVLNPGGALILSGFYTEDIPALMEVCNAHFIHYQHHSEMDNWVGVVCRK